MVPLSPLEKMQMQVEGAISSISGRVATIEKILLRTLERNNCTAPEPATAAGLSNAARSQASEVHRRRALELLNAGHTPSQVARKMGLAEGTIHRYRREARA
jgi:DNA-binding NarL/FixJ family response regulator